MVVVDGSISFAQCRFRCNEFDPSLRREAFKCCCSVLLGSKALPSSCLKRQEQENKKKEEQRQKWLKKHEHIDAGHRLGHGNTQGNKFFPFGEEKVLLRKALRGRRFSNSTTKTKYTSIHYETRLLRSPRWFALFCYDPLWSPFCYIPVCSWLYDFATFQAPFCCPNFLTIGIQVHTTNNLRPAPYLEYPNSSIAAKYVTSNTTPVEQQVADRQLEQWFHAECVNLSNKDFKSLTKKNLPDWKCSSCHIVSTQNNEHHSSHEPTLVGKTSPSKTNPLSESLQELEKSLTDCSAQSNEENLIVAAKIGSALLQENGILKKENLRLLDKLSSLQAKIEELENCENKHFSNMERLQEKVSELEAQLTKEKQYSIEAQAIFEDHDRKLNMMIDDHEQKIQDLESKLITLKRQIPEKSNRLFCNAETQTLTPDSQTNTTSPSLLLEMGYLKNHHIILEEKLKNLEATVKNLTVTKITEECAPELKMPIHKNKTQFNNIKKPVFKKEKNKFSVSLQVKKMKTSVPNAKTPFEDQTPKSLITSTPTNKKEPHSSTYPSSTVKERLPPMTARIRPDNENLEDFFTKHIDYYTRINQHYLNISTSLHSIPAHDVTGTRDPINSFSEDRNCFLGNTQQKKIIA
ncbi:hypothetical protein J6590_016548 [Homalodisca vitripennis]|nr:hypothetical protein J6590_016548 [Homalodisca vitripennis]